VERLLLEDEVVVPLLLVVALTRLREASRLLDLEVLGAVSALLVRLRLERLKPVLALLRPVLALLRPVLALLLSPVLELLFIEEEEGLACHFKKSCAASRRGAFLPWGGLAVVVEDESGGVAVVDGPVMVVDVDERRDDVLPRSRDSLRCCIRPGLLLQRLI